MVNEAPEPTPYSRGPEAPVESSEQWESLLSGFRSVPCSRSFSVNLPEGCRERFTKEGQQPNDRLNIVRAPKYHSRGSWLTGSVFQLIELRDKLNETLAEATRLASSAPNENLPISRLPSEVFLYICRLVCPWTTHRTVFEAIALTHVCRRWRDALLSYPIIWSHIYVWHNFPQPLIDALLHRSCGVPLTIDIQYYSNPTTRFGCDCSSQDAQEDGDYCPHTIIQPMPSLDFLEPFRAEIHRLNVRYLRCGRFDGGTMEDIRQAPFFFKSFPNLESLRWSCRHFIRVFPSFVLPRELFGSSLPRLQRLSMVNCWGLSSTDTPVLKAMSVERTTVGYIEGSVNQLVCSLRRRRSLVSLSLKNYHITATNNHPSPVSMEDLKEIALLNVDSEVVFRYIKCPSIGTITTLQIVPSAQRSLSGDCPVSIHATDGSGGSISSLAFLVNDDSTLKTIWEELAPAFQHAVTTLEVEDLHLIEHSVTAIPKLTDVLPHLHTIRVRLLPVARSFEVLRDILSRKPDITQVERLVCGTESADEARRNDEEWKALCVEYKVHGFLA